LTQTQNLESVDLDSITSHRILIDALFNLSTAHIVRNDLVKSEFYALQAFRIAKYLLEYSFVNPESKFYYVFYYRQHVSKILDLLIENNATETAYKVMAESKSLLFRIEYDQSNNNQQSLNIVTAGVNYNKDVVDDSLVKNLIKWNKKNKSDLIDYFIYEDKLYIFHLSKDQLQVKTKKIDQKNRDQIVSLHNDISDVNTNSFDSILIHSNQLYELLLKDVLTNSKRQAKNLVIIPDDELHFLPFEILSAQSEKEIANNRYDQINYLINDYDVSYHYSSLLMTDDHGLSQEYAGFAPFNNKNTSKDDFSFLPNSEEEIDYANQLFEGTVFKESSADTTQLFHAINHGGILHIATHTSEDSLVENLNRLVLSNGMIGSERIDSIACDLAVLSACKTAHGELKKGEGLISISRTFLSRGAKSVLTSLWNINDKSALTISSLFFDHLYQGNNIAKSLSSSKREYLETIKSPIQAHPYYWAGFVNIGNHQLKIEKGYNPILLVLLLPICILIYLFYNKVSSN
jgi:CHAT domain-containing protein